MDLIKNPPVLNESDKLREAIDFHCFPGLLRKCTDLVQGIFGDCHAQTSTRDLDGGDIISCMVAPIFCQC